MALRAILFDLDGTLIDQFDAIHRAFSQVIEKMGLPVPDYETVKKAVGGASESTMAKLIGQSRAKEAVNLLRPIFEKEMFNGLQILPWAKDALSFCAEHKIKTAVLTNKHGPHARAACKHLDILPPLEFALGANDTTWKKPEIELTRHALNKIGHSTEETLYIGDSPYDLRTARNVGMQCCLVATGTHSVKELREEEPESIDPDLQTLFKERIQPLLQQNCF